MSELQHDADELEQHLVQHMMMWSRGANRVIRGSTGAVAGGVGLAGRGIAHGAGQVGHRVSNSYHLRNDVPTMAETQRQGGMVVSLEKGANPLPGDKVDMTIDEVGNVSTDQSFGEGASLSEADQAGSYVLFDGASLSEAENVVVVAPGQDAASYAGTLTTAKTLSAECGPNTGVVVMGGPLKPESLTESADLIKQENPNARVTYVAHDSSAELAGKAVQNGLKAESVVLVGTKDSEQALAAAETASAGSGAKVYSKVVDANTAYAPASDLVQGIGQVANGRGSQLLTAVSAPAVEASLSSEERSSKMAMAGVAPADRIVGAGYGTSVASKGGGQGHFPGVIKER